MRGTTVTGEQLVRIAHPDVALANFGAATVSFDGRDAAHRSSLLTPGEAVTLTDGPLINAYATFAS